MVGARFRYHFLECISHCEGKIPLIIQFCFSKNFRASPLLLCDCLDIQFNSGLCSIGQRSPIQVLAFLPHMSGVIFCVFYTMYSMYGAEQLKL